MPIREALQQLQGEGLIQLIPNRGAVIRAVDEKFIRDIYDIREILEVFFTSRAATHAAPDDIAELIAIQQSYEKYTSLDDVGVRLKLNLEFHARIYKLAGNDEALAMIGRHAGITRALIHRYNHSPERIYQICQQHRAVIQAISARDPETAGKIAGQHMRDARDDLLVKFNQAPIVKSGPKARAVANNPSDANAPVATRGGVPEMRVSERERKNAS
jgi:DNA-binding GntR family transcriptional regulator